jgi:RHS repeat-associated protein
VVQRQVPRASRRPDVWQYQWDAADRLVAVTTPDHTIWRYRYDPFGRRIAKQRLGPDGEVTDQTDFSWDGPMLAEQATTVRAGAAVRHQVVSWDYRPASFTPLTQAEHCAAGELSEAPQDQIDQRFYAIITDLVGAPTELAAPDGTLAGSQQRSLWGSTAWRSGQAETPLRYPGQYADPETGLHYNNHRYYDPEAAAYLTPDPLGLAPAPNPHAYVANPLMLADPLGLMPYATGEPGGGQVSLFRASPRGQSQADFDHGYDPANFPGSGNAYPDGRAYFGVNEPSIAQEYAALNNYDSQIIETRIPSDVFENIFKDHVSDYDGGPRVQIGVPRDLIPVLNQFPRFWFIP